MAEDFISGALAGQQFQLNKLKLLEAPVRLEQEKIALKISQQSYNERQKLVELLNQHSATIPEGQNPLTNAANSLVQIGSAEAQAGMVEEATKTLSHAATITTQQESTAYKNWQMVSQQTKFADSMLATVTDQHSLDKANAYVKLVVGRSSPLEGQTYSPELIETFKRLIETKRTEAQEALTKAQTVKAKLDTAASTELVTLRKTQEALNVVRAENLRKVGGEGLIAKPRTVSAVTSALIADNPSLEPNTARTFAADIALDVETRMSRDHQTQGQAVASAIDFARKHGTLAGIPPAHSRPGSAKKPLPLPGAVAGYKNQMWYAAPDGGWPDTKTNEPRWYDEETKSVYPAGSGPGDEEEETEE